MTSDQEQESEPVKEPESEPVKVRIYCVSVLHSNSENDISRMCNLKFVITLN